MPFEYHGDIVFCRPWDVDHKDTYLKELQRHQNNSALYCSRGIVMLAVGEDLETWLSVYEKHQSKFEDGQEEQVPLLK